MIVKGRHGSLIMEHRTDIEGLRGVAVASVVLYHLDISLFGGGFVGVDIFFVISGYLITSILYKNYSDGVLSLRLFYVRRIRRLIPAFMAMLLFATLASLLILLPSDLRLFGKASLASLLSSSNIYFWRTSGYFEASAELNPLLHSWSLGVEEQFYIIYPFLLAWLFRYGKSRCIMILLAIGFMSLVMEILAQSRVPSATFFLLPFRAWELLIGGVLSLLLCDMQLRLSYRSWLAGLGMVLLGLSIVNCQPGLGYPGWQAILPVLGASLVIAAGSSGSHFLTGILSLAPIRYTGLISYSLYLWHWPLIVFSKYRLGDAVFDKVKFIILVSSFVLAHLSYSMVESRFRLASIANVSYKQNLKFSILMLTGIVVLFAVSLLLIEVKGFPSRFSSDVQLLDLERQPVIPYVNCQYLLPQSPKFMESCILGRPNGNVSIAIWGDSHALAWAPAFSEALLLEDRSGYLIFHSGCPPLIGVNVQGIPGCIGFNDLAIAYLESDMSPAVIVLVASWLAYSRDGGTQVCIRSGSCVNSRVFAESFSGTLARLRRAGKSVWIIGPTPGAEFDVPFELTRALAYDMGSLSKSRIEKYNDRSKEFYDIASHQMSSDRVLLIRPDDILCREDGCSYEVDGKPLYRDNHHLSLHGAHIFTQLIRSLLSRLD